MTTRDVQQASADALARLMAVGAQEEEWSPEELAEIFRHQLAMPIKLEPDPDAASGQDDPAGGRRGAGRKDDSGGGRRIARRKDDSSGAARSVVPPGEEPEAMGALRVGKGATPPPLAPALTFGEALRHPLPDLEVLQAIKSYAKAEWKSVERQLPKELAISLYFLAIAAALARRGRRISNLDAVQLSRSFRSVLQASWIDGFHRMLLEEGMRCLEAGVVE